MSADHSPGNPPAGTVKSPDGDFTGSVKGDLSSAGHVRHQVPDAIERRYLHIDDRYFFPDRTLAFIDDGDRIRVRTENREVLHSVVAIAQARGWRIIELRGTEAFRQNMWREAALRGIEVRGYEPTQAEILQVQRALKKWQPSHEAGQAPDPASSDGATAITHAGSLPTGPGRNAGGGPAEARQGSQSFREGPRPPVKGMFMAAAAAPYQFDPTQRMSFYVMVRTEIGDRTIWGADLERALAESASQPRIGNQVVLMRHGTHPVHVRVPARDAEGELVGEKKIIAQRTRWSVETPNHLHVMERRAEHVRTRELPTDAALDHDPELTMAAASLKLAEQYAQRLTTDQVSHQRLVQLIRERMADALGQGHLIHLPSRRMRPAPMHVQQRTIEPPPVR